MEAMIKKVSLAIATLGLSASAYAAHIAEPMLPAAPPTVNVTIPQQVGSWSIAVEALYGQVTNGNFNYASVNDPAIDVDLANDFIGIDYASKIKSVKPDYNWGWKLDLMYNFEGNGRDAQLTWTHYNHHTSSSTTDADGTYMLGTGFAILPAWDVAEGHTKADYDAVDLMFGQKMDFADKVMVRLSGGMRYVDLRNKDHGEYFLGDFIDGDDDTFVEEEISYKSQFQGLGPRAAVNTRVALGGGFSVVGSMGTSLLIGSQKASLNDQIDILVEDTLLIDIDAGAKKTTSTRIVPELDMRLGVNYTYAFNPDTALGVELGWEAVNYFNVKDTSLMGYLDTVSGAEETDFGLQGPYLRLQLDIA